MEKIIRGDLLISFERWLCSEEKSRGTVEKYCRDVRRFQRWIEGGAVSREAGACWKEQLLKEGYSPVTVNSMAAALNTFFRFMGWEDCRIRFLKVQRKNYRSQHRHLDKSDYEQLVKQAKKSGRERLALLMEAVGATGVRVSEVRYLTVEAAKSGQAEIHLKGKIRTILIPEQIQKRMLSYAQKEGIQSGPVFLTGKGKPLSRGQIWAEMKRLAKASGVEPSKVFPHNLRHLFAQTFYCVSKDLAGLADVLGHSSVNTTRLYLMTTEKQQRKNLNRLSKLLL